MGDGELQKRSLLTSEICIEKQYGKMDLAKARWVSLDNVVAATREQLTVKELESIYNIVDKLMDDSHGFSKRYVLLRLLKQKKSRIKWFGDGAEE